MSISIGKQIGLYSLSLLLPPLGLWPGIKYLLQDNPKAKVVGAVAILLTVISLGGTIYYMSVFMKMYTSQFSGQINNQINSQVNSQVQQNLDQIPLDR
jgi:hypothetical protein